MSLDHKSTISGALISYLIITAIQTFTVIIDKSLRFDFSAALNCAIAAIMIIGAWMILKERRAGFIMTIFSMLIGISWSLIILFQHPVISGFQFWITIMMYLIVILLAAPYALKKKHT